VVARIDELGRSAIVRDAVGDVSVPNIVFFDDEELVFGRAANSAAIGEPSRAGESSKRDLGQAAYSRAIGGQLLSAEFIEACLLKHLATGFTSAGSPRPAVVLSVPASFNHAQRQAMFEAGQIAGLDVLGVLSDTIASTLAFAESQGYLEADATRAGCRILVFDLGGGALDVAIVEVKPKRIRTMAVGGDARLGGREWDSLFADHLAGEFNKQFGEDPRHDMSSVRRLFAAAEEAKQTLTVRQQVRVHLERAAHAADVTISRQTFEDVTESLRDRIQRMLELVLSRSGLAWRDLSCVLLVGGATRMPAVGKLLETLTGLKPAVNIHPQEAVARGAAIYAERLLAARDGRSVKIDVEIANLTSHSLGVEWIDPASGRAENAVVIQRGTEMPTTAVSRTMTTIDGQASLLLRLLEGESRDAEECARVAEVLISDLPVGLPKGWPIEVQYRYDQSGRLHVQARLEKKDRPLAVELRHHGVLPADEAADWRKLLAGRVGLRTILDLLGRHQKKREEAAGQTPQPGAPLAEPQSGAAVSQAVAADPDHANLPDIEDLDFDLAELSGAGRYRKQRLTSRNLTVMLVGYVVSAVIGLGLGYYILMRIDPTYNWLNLPLPGVAPHHPGGGAAGQRSG
jgi:molecular chaperone DnaK